MFRKFSKPSKDLAEESLKWRGQSKRKHEEQKNISQFLQSSPQREACILCLSSLDSAIQFNHREVEFLQCRVCKHVQSKSKIPIGYPWDQMGGGFESVYQPLNNVDYISRRDRVYKPKLDWIIEALSAELKSDVEVLKKKNWLEIGSGVGYFVDALLDRGISNVSAIEANKTFCDAIRMRSPNVNVINSCNFFRDIEVQKFDILVMFFVIEHVENAYDFWEHMKKIKPGTLLVFSVPTLGLTTLFENALTQFSARNLDAIVHTQMYTDHSIDFALKRAGFKKISEWLFGQDAQDLFSVIFNCDAAKLAPISEILNDQNILRFTDGLQQLLDAERLCDQRHIIALKG